MIKKVILLLIIVLAFLFRFWNLGNYPALNADEAAIGYNAYSLIQTGKDEHGNKWPIHFQSFNDYKPGGYVYIVLPFVKFFGLNEWIVRFPNAFLGILTVYLVYLLTKELFGKEKLALVSSFVLAISPWHIHFSRGGWEVNSATFFVTLGVLLFVKFTKNLTTKYLYLSILSFVFSLYTYHSARLIAPLLGLGLILIYKKEVFTKSNFKKLTISFILLLFTLLPLAKSIVGPEGVSRAAGVGLLADTGPLNRVNEQRGEHHNFGRIESKIIHNKFVNYSLAFLSNYLKHYHGLFLFLSGDDIQRNKVPETGQMYMIDVFFVLVGMLILIKSFQNKSSKLVFYWLLIGPIASALTFQSPHALRSQNMVIPLAIICSLGISWLFNRLSQKGVPGNFVKLIFLLIIALSVLRYDHMYFKHMSKEYPFSSQYGVKELIEYLNSGVGDKYVNYLVTDRYDQPYILFLFYTKYDPAKFQNDHTLTSRDQYGFSTVRKFDKYVFVSISDWDKLRSEYKNSLVAGTNEEIFPGTNVVKEIYGSNGYLYFQIIAN